MSLLTALLDNPTSGPSTGRILYSLSLLLFVHGIRRAKRWYRLRHIPGPPFAGWTSLWLTKRYLDGTFSKEVPALADQYVLELIQPVEAPSYGSHPIRSKSEWYRIGRISRGGDNIFSMLDPELRKERKKYIMPAYTGKGVDHFEEGTDRALAAWIDLIERKYVSTPDKVTPMDFEEKAHFYALDAIGEIAWSESFENVKEDRDTKGVLAVNDATVPILMAVGNYMTFWRILRTWPFYYLLPNDGDESGFGAMVGHASDIIAKRFKPNAAPKRDMLQSFIDLGLRGEGLKQEVGIQFVAGSDTVSSLLYTTFLLLLTHPATYARLQAELDAAHSAASTQAPPASSDAVVIRDAQARTLPYLQAVIREGLRLFPPLCAPPMYKEVPRGGDMLCGYALPGGTLVATGNQMWHGNREKGFWGADADCFRPERWLEEGLDAERLVQMNRRVELAFGSGQFVCVGKGIAMVEVGKVIGELVRRYNWSLADPINPPRIRNNGVWLVRDFWVRVEKR
ncbi:hypothetical protein VTI74DRAFT_6752 [Chaetomium olivicolor]